VKRRAGWTPTGIAIRCIGEHRVLIDCSLFDAGLQEFPSLQMSGWHFF
jgi:hypothetical protein